MALSKIDAVNFLTGTIPSGNIATSSLPTGTVLQVVNQFFDTQTSINASAFTDTGMTANITPASSSNKVLVSFYPSFSSADNSYCAFKIFRDSTEIGSSTISGTGIECFGGWLFSTSEQYGVYQSPMVFLDSPSSTSSLTYKLQVSPMRTSSYQFYLNRSHTQGDENQFGGTSSNTVLMEIAGWY